MRRKKYNWMCRVYTHTSMLVNIFKDAGQVVEEIWGGARTLVAHGLYVIDSNAWGDGYDG